MEEILKKLVYYLPFILIFIFCVIVITIMSNIIFSIKEDINTIANFSKSIDWYIPKEENNKRPIFPNYVNDHIEKYGIYVMGEDKKELYLTFNCGYEYKNFTNEILNVLKEKKIKAAFFITGDYLRNNPNIVNRMIDEGHIIGNHGNTHAFLTELNDEEIKIEIQVLYIANNLGYKTVFWTFAYKDWETEHQATEEKVYKNIMDYAHNGGIIMLHTVSLSNKEVLLRVISDLNNNVYIFKSLDEFK